LQLFHLPAKGFDGLHERLVCHSVAPLAAPRCTAAPAAGSSVLR
jgi:hypothetical protein